MDGAETPEAGGRDFIQALGRGLAVLGVFSREHPSVTLSEAAELTGTTRATARRILLTLEQLGFVSSRGRRFAPTPRLLGLGYAYLSSLDLWDVAERHMERLSEQTMESCSAATLDGGEIVYVARVPTRRVMGTALSIGSRLPAYCTAMGRVLLAALPPEELDERLARTRLAARTDFTVVDATALRGIVASVREHGYAVNDEELELGLRSVAAPIRDGRGEVVAALNVAAHAGRVSRQQLEQAFLPPLLEAATAIGEAFARR